MQDDFEASTAEAAPVAAAAAAGVAPGVALILLLDHSNTFNDHESLSCPRGDRHHKVRHRCLKNGLEWEVAR